jgi:hypothetical protein
VADTQNPKDGVGQWAGRLAGNGKISHKGRQLNATALTRLPFKFEELFVMAARFSA